MGDTKYMPSGEPNLKTDKDPLEYRTVPGVTFFEEGDGILYYYDQPIMFVAWIEGQKVVVTLLAEDCNYPDKPRKGWQEVIAFPVTDEFLDEIYNSKTHLRNLWEQEPNRNWFIHNEWQKIGEKEWVSEYQVFRDVAVQDRWKPDEGCYLSMNGKNED